MRPKFIERSRDRLVAVHDAAIEVRRELDALSKKHRWDPDERDTVSDWVLEPPSDAAQRWYSLKYEAALANLEELAPIREKLGDDDLWDQDQINELRDFSRGELKAFLSSSRAVAQAAIDVRSKMNRLEKVTRPSWWDDHGRELFLELLFDD